PRVQAVDNVGGFANYESAAPPTELRRPTFDFKTRPRFLQSGRHVERNSTLARSGVTLILGGAAVHRCDNCLFSESALAAEMRLQCGKILFPRLLRGLRQCLILVIGLVGQEHPERVDAERSSNRNA